MSYGLLKPDGHPDDTGDGSKPGFFQSALEYFTGCSFYKDTKGSQGADLKTLKELPSLEHGQSMHVG